MFKNLFVAAAVVATLTLSAVPAIADPTPAQPVANTVVTELSPVVYGPSWVLNNFKDFSKANNLVTVFNELGATRTWFHVTQLTNVTAPGFGNDEVVAIKNDKGQYLTQWNHQNPAVNGWRARWNWVNGDVVNYPSAQWVVVPNADNSSYALVEVSSLNNDNVLALTVAQGGGVKETNGVAKWSDLVLLPLNVNGDNVPTDKAQLFTFKNIHPFVKVTEPVDLVK